MSHPDAMIGGKIRERRRILGLTQTNVANAIGVTPQQVQKYELGTNRVASSTLIKICRFLDIKIEEFFGSLINSPAVAETPSVDYHGSVSAHNSPDRSLDNQSNSILQSSREMVDVFCRIKDSKLREDLLRLAKSMSESNR